MVNLELLIFLFILFVFVLKDGGYKKGKKRTYQLMLFAVGMLPFYHLISSDFKFELIWQTGSLFVMVYYFILSTPNETNNVIIRVKPIILPTALVMGIFALSYLNSEKLEKENILYLFCFLSSPVYSLFACFYCKTVEDIEKLIFILITFGLLQFPIIIGQATGFTDMLSGNLSSLSTDGWGGPLASVSGVTRYPGSFGDVELFAEYIGIMFLLALGEFLLPVKRKHKKFIGFSLVIFLIMGGFTGTRGFLIGILLGIIVLVALIQLKSNKKSIIFKRVFIIGILLISSIILLMPKVIISGFIDRLLMADTFGSNLLNRGTLFSTWIYLSKQMPLLGYGAQMIDVVRLNFNYFFIQSPHSLFFSMLLIAGYPGLVVIILFIFKLFLLSIKCLKNKTNSLISQYGIIFIVILVYWAANEVKIEFLRLIFYSNYLFFLWGILSSLYSLSLNEKKILHD
jgi:hypothetical protein